jgi:anti-sigma B factor antagonist
VFIVSNKRLVERPRASERGAAGMSAGGVRALRIRERRPAPAAAIVRVSGEIDLATAGALGERLARIVDGGARRLVVDLGEVRFVDSSILGPLLCTHRRLLARGGALRIAGVTERALRVLGIVGDGALMALVEEPRAARRWLERGVPA